MKVETGTPNRGKVLLAELKALVDSVPHPHRADVIKTIELVFSGLDADTCLANDNCHPRAVIIGTGTAQTTR